MEPPRAERRPTPVELHGLTWNDDWAWLRDGEDPAVLEHLRAENAYAEHVLAPQAPRQERLFEEIRARTRETDASAPVRHGGWWYQDRTEEGLEYGRTVRWPIGGGPEQVVLDANVEAAGRDYFQLGVARLSPDHRLLAWSRDDDGSEVFSLRVRDIAAGTDLDDLIPRTAPSVAWSADGTHLFYAVPDEAMRAHQIWRHRLGAPVADDVLVYEEPDERFSVGVHLTRSGAWLVVGSASITTAEHRVLPADDPTGEWRVVEPRRDGHDHSIDHRGDVFVILTNDGAEDFRVVEAPVASPGRDSWREVLPHRAGTRVTDVDAFAGHLVVSEWADGLPRLRILTDAGARVLEHDDAVWDVGLDDNPEFHTDVVRYSYASLAVPPTTFEEDVDGRERRLLRRHPVPGVDLGAYVTERRWATARDGVRVPMSLVRHRDTPVDGTAPGLLYGYGAYEISLPPWFSVARLSLLDRGVVFAIAHVRGGGELGRRWYLDGKMRVKPHSFDDLIACAEQLGADGVVDPRRLAVRGGSAGGLLVGGALSRRPELFAAVVAEVPFVDCVNTLLDPSLPLTVPEWEEWGNPRDPDDFAVIRSYTPYENVPAAELPAMLVTAGLHDPRVGFHEPAKWVARLRATATGGGPVLLRTELGAGHGGPSGRYARWRDEALVLAFVLDALGVPEP